MNRRIVVGTVGCLALLGLVGCYYPPDTQPVVSSNSNQPEELQLTAAESNQLRNLHTFALQKFLEVPDLGMNRMGIGMGKPLHIVPSDVLDRIVEEQQGQNPVSPSTLRFLLNHNANKATKLNLTRALRVNNDLAVLKFEELGVRFEQVQLMGIAKQPEPTVFDIQEDTAPEARPTRPLDAFEQRGLARLQASSSMYVENVNGQLRMLAPIYAGATCVSCHSKQGELLGAFSYTLAK